MLCADGKPVPGEGPADAGVMLIGQNPGAEESRLGRPFVGRAGKYLDGALKASGINREALFITSVVKCRTPHNRKPAAREIAACLPLLLEQVRQVRPRIIVLMGEIAWKTPMLPGITYLTTYHPAAAMRFPLVRQKFEADLKKLRSLMEEAGMATCREKPRNDRLNERVGGDG